MPMVFCASFPCEVSSSAPTPRRRFLTASTHRHTILSQTENQVVSTRKAHLCLMTTGYRLPRDGA